MKSALLVLLISILLISCTSNEQKKNNYYTKDFDIWIACQIVEKDGQMQIISYAGGNLMLFEVLLMCMEELGQKLGYLPPMEDNARMIPYNGDSPPHPLRD